MVSENVSYAVAGAGTIGALGLITGYYKNIVKQIVEQPLSNSPRRDRQLSDIANLSSAIRHLGLLCLGLCVLAVIMAAVFSTYFPLTFSYPPSVSKTLICIVGVTVTSYLIHYVSLLRTTHRTRATIQSQLPPT